MTNQVQNIDFTGWNLDKLYDGFYNLLNNHFHIEHAKISIPYLESMIGTQYNKSLPGVLHYSPHIDEQNNKMPIFRVVPYEKKPLQIKDCSYNPKPNKFQRCNFPGESVFYAADTENAAIRETEIRIYDRFILSKWEFNILDTYSHIFLFNDAVGNESKKEFIKYAYKQLLEGLKKDYETEHFNFALHLLKAQTQMIISNNYFLSSYLSHNFLYLPGTIPFEKRWMIYPALKSYHIDNNIALPKSLVDSGNVKPIEFTYAIRLENGVFRLNKGIPSSNGVDIDWK